MSPMISPATTPQAILMAQPAIWNPPWAVESLPAPTKAEYVTVLGVVVLVPLLKLVKVVVVAVWPTPCRTAEKMAAKREGSRKWKRTLFESTTPFSFSFLLKRVCDSEARKPIVNPMAVAAPGL